MKNINPSQAAFPYVPFSRISLRVALWAVITGMAIALPAAYVALLVPVPLPDATAISANAHRIGSLSPMVLFLMVVIVAPLWEELFFRGIILQVFRRYMPAWLAVLAITLIFALGHIGISLQNVFAAFIIGLHLAWLLMRSSSMYPGILCHAAANFFWNFVVRLVPASTSTTGRGILADPMILLLLCGSVVALIVGIKILRKEFAQAAQTVPAA